MNPINSIIRSLQKIKYKNTQGVIYIVTKSDECIRECFVSAASLKNHNPEIPITLFTDRTDIRNDLFDNVKIIRSDKNPLKLKVINLVRSPYYKTMFLDTDTKIESDISELFILLDSHPFIIAREPLMDYTKKPFEFLGFRNNEAFNTGFFLFRLTKDIRQVLDHWAKIIDGHDDKDMYPGHYCDQFHFNRKLMKDERMQRFISAIHEVDNKIYNTRIWAYEQMDEETRQKVKIKHWHGMT